MELQLLFYAQITKVSWTKNARSGDSSKKRVAALNKAQPLPLSLSSPVTIELIEYDEVNNFSANNSHFTGEFNTSLAGDIPFALHQIDDAMQVEFNPELEKAGWRPTRFYKRQANGSTWLRPKQLFTLHKGQAGRFTINYYHGNRTLTGASKAPQFMQITGLFYYFASEKHPPSYFQFELDETMIIR